ncbi:PilZ domain-containing protein [Sedimenticola sp.]|uniref:PilZ domain-containing protein n=1 Tax=Sedimenticola sp. TaxID=1940285 RepID=UPI003D0C42EC
MEHRNSPRRPVMLYTMLNYPSLGWVRGCIRDIGMGGMFVDIGRIQLPVNATLQASLMLGASDLKCHMQVEAIVVRCAEQGVGLMFDELDSDIRHALNRLIFGPSGVQDDNGCSEFLH